MLDAFSMTIIWFDIIKFDNDDWTIFWDCDHSSMTIIMKMIWIGINNYNYYCN